MSKIIIYATDKAIAYAEKGNLATAKEFYAIAASLFIEVTINEYSKNIEDFSVCEDVLVGVNGYINYVEDNLNSDFLNYTMWCIS